MKEKFDVSGMTCASCQAHVEKAVRKVPGVKDVTVNLLSNNMVVEFEEGRSPAQEIVRAVEGAGYGASPAGARAAEKAAQPTELPAEKQMRSMRFRLIVSFLMLVPMMYVSMGHMVGLPLPHMGWNRVYPEDTPHARLLFRGIEAGDWFYFVHSYAMPTGACTTARCTYGEEFTAAAAHENFMGVQFHPERSGRAGARLIANFLGIEA